MQSLAGERQTSTEGGPCRNPVNVPCLMQRRNPKLRVSEKPEKMRTQCVRLWEVRLWGENDSTCSHCGLPHPQSKAPLPELGQF